MDKIIKSKKAYDVTCKKCLWKGSKYKILIALDGDYCPKCGAKNTFTYLSQNKKDK